MEFQHEKSWDSLTTIFDSKLTAKDAWNKFIDFHEQTVPKSYWTSLRQLDIEEEQTEITQWLHQLVSASDIPDNIVALWIGILKFVHDEKEIPAIYLVGANTYEKDDIDWAYDATYKPDNRYVQPCVLKEIDNIAKTDEDNYEFFDWIFPLAYCTFTLDEIIRTKLDKKLFLKSKNKLFAAVGHDGGDFMNLSTIE